MLPVIVANDLSEFCTKAAESTEGPGGAPGWLSGFQSSLFPAIRHHLKSIL